MFNIVLSKCRSIYILGCSEPHEIEKELDPLVQKIWKVKSEKVGPLVVYARDRRTKEIVAFIGFTRYIEDKKRIYISLSGTDRRYERRGLSTLLRLYIIAFGIINKYDEVTSGTNEKSGPILAKLGFEQVDGETHYEKLLKKAFPQKGEKPTAEERARWYHGIVSENPNMHLLLEKEYLGPFTTSLKKFKNCGVVSNEPKGAGGGAAGL